MNSWFLLALAIIAEVIATASLKASSGFTRLWPSMIVVSGYGVAFYLLALALRTIPVGTAYAIWSGVGIALIALAGVVLYGQRLGPAGLVGIGLIIAGVALLSLQTR